MMSISKPGSLLVVCGSPTNGNNHPKLSPVSSHGSWKDSLDDLSKELKKICYSPISNPGSPKLSRNSPDMVSTPSPDANISPGSLKKQESGEGSFPHFHIPAVLVQNITDDHTVLRVRHEETKDLLQKRLSMISGYKTNNSDDNLQSQRRPSKEVAALAVSSKTHHVNRFRTLVNIGNCPHDDLKVVCKNNNLSLYQICKGKADVELRQVQIPASLDMDRLICTVNGQSLEVTEYPKKAIFTESVGFKDNNNAQQYHCPTIVDDVRNNLWKLVWNVPEQFQTNQVMVKTLDEKLVVICRQRNASGSNSLNLELEKLLSSGGNNNGYTQQKQLNAPSNTTQNGQHYMKISIELPENVEPKTVSAMITGNKQLIIRGISSWRARCVTY